MDYQFHVIFYMLPTLGGTVAQSTAAGKVRSVCSTLSRIKSTSRILESKIKSPYRSTLLLLALIFVINTLYI